MRPVAWSTSYLLRCPLGISTVTSKSISYSSSRRVATDASSVTETREKHEGRGPVGRPDSQHGEPTDSECNSSDQHSPASAPKEQTQRLEASEHTQRLASS